MVFKKSLTPLSKKGNVTVNRGKGSTVQRTAPREPETLTGGNPMARMMNQYPAAPQPVAQPAPMAAPAPTAAMPGAGVPNVPV